MRRLALVTVAVLLCLSAGVAQGQPMFGSRVDPVQAAITIGARYWHAYPCGWGHLTVVYGSPPVNDEAEPVGTQAAMWSSWDSAWGANNERAPQPFSHCVLGINSAVWPTREFMAYTAWPEFAVDVIHEMGHLLGHGHSANSADVMYPEPSAHTVLTGTTLWST